MHGLFTSFGRALRHSAMPLINLLVAAGTAMLATPAGAVQFSTADQGHIRLSTFLSLQQVQHFEFDTAMSVKSLSCCGGPTNAFVGDRAYAFFAVPNDIDLSGRITLHFDASLAGPGASSLTLNEIFSQLAPFQSNYADDDATGIGLFIDLGNGPTYASTSVSAGQSSFALTLSDDARSRMDGQRGGFVGIGFSAGLSDVDNPMTLSNMTLEVAAVPEPAVVWLLLSGMLLVLWSHRRRNAH